MRASKPVRAPRQRRVALAGSHRADLDDATCAGAPDARQRLIVSIYLKNPDATRSRPGSAAHLARLAAPMTRRQFARERRLEFAPAVAAIRRFARDHGVTLRKVDYARRRVEVAGRADRIAAAFGTTLNLYDDGKCRYLARSGALTVPAAIAPWVRAVLGLDQRPGMMPLAGDADGDGLWPTEVAALYGLPLDEHGAGQCVGIVALGGGYLRSDLEAAAQNGRPVPTIVERFIGGAVNQPVVGSPADEEIALDMQIVAALVPAARIVVYFAPNNLAGLAEALHEAVHDGANRPQVLSICWGSAEKFWPDDVRDAAQAALEDAVQLKVSVTVAAGDYLATGGVSDGDAHVYYPASSPLVLACGGTSAVVADGRIASEEVWKRGLTGTGGGISDVFPVPAYQSAVALPPSVNDGGRRRGMPDVAGMADREPGYRIVLGGEVTVKDGTSAVAPLWAALITMLNARRGAPIGLINPALYADPALCRPIVAGDNAVGAKGYRAGPGWSACTGLGVPKAADILAALAAVPAA